MWRRIVHFLLRRPCPSRNAAVDVLFAENLTAHERAGQASVDVARASDRNRHRLERVREEIAERTAAEEQMRPQPHTSDVRSLVETALARVQPRPEQKGQG